MPPRTERPCAPIFLPLFLKAVCRWSDAPGECALLISAKCITGVTFWEGQRKHYSTEATLNFALLNSAMLFLFNWHTRDSNCEKYEAGQGIELFSNGEKSRANKFLKLNISLSYGKKKEAVAEILCSPEGGCVSSSGKRAKKRKEKMNLFLRALWVSRWEKVGFRKTQTDRNKGSGGESLLFLLKVQEFWSSRQILERLREPPAVIFKCGRTSSQIQ